MSQTWYNSQQIKRNVPWLLATVGDARHSEENAMSDMIIPQPYQSVNSIPNVSGVYVITFAEYPKYFKIGYSMGIPKRLSDINNATPFNVVLAHHIPCNPSIGCNIIERLLHKHFAKQRVKREWFELSAAQIQAVQAIKPFDASEGVARAIDVCFADAIEHPFQFKLRSFMNARQKQHLAFLSERERNPHSEVGEWLLAMEMGQQSFSAVNTYELLRLVELGLAEYRQAKGKRTRDVLTNRDYRISRFGKQCYVELVADGETFDV